MNPATRTTIAFRSSAAFVGLLLFLLVSLATTGCGGGNSSPPSRPGGGGSNQVVSAGRTKYVRSDAPTTYYGWINSHWIVFNPPTSRFFMTDPASSRVLVYDSATETQVGVIGVPGAYGIGDSVDHHLLYVGTLIGDVYTVDPVTMVVTNRYLAAQIGPYGYSASIALGLADGRVALLEAGVGIASVDGSPTFAVWNPIDNSIAIYASAYGSVYLPPGTPYTLVCGPNMGNIAGFTLTADRSKVIVGSTFSDGTLCKVDAATGADTFGTAVGFSMNNIATSPDGNLIILPHYPSKADVYSASTLEQIAEFNVASIAASNSSFFVSTDSKTLFVPSDTDSIVYAYSLESYQQTGWVPGIYLESIGGGGAVGPVYTPFLLANDGNGLFAGPMEEGIGFVDIRQLQTGSVGTKFTNGYLVPATGPASGGTATQWSDPNALGTLAGVNFNDKAATSFSASGGMIRATSPAGSAGPVDVYAFTTDGAMQLLPEAFSYGPAILQVTPDKATQEGGGIGLIYGYGFGPTNSQVIPPGVQVTVAGKTAQITGFTGNAYSLSAPPFPLQALAYVVPPGTAGSTGDVTVATPGGQVAVQSAFSYLPTLQKFPINGAVLVQGIYDPYRDVYYFTDAKEIRVFSRTLGAWLNPINIPTPPKGIQRLWGISLSPNGTKLAVSDAVASVIYLLDPSNPGTVQTFDVPTIPNVPGVITNACGVAVSDSGTVYYAAFVDGGTGYDQFFKLDTQSGAVTGYFTGPGTTDADVYLRAVMSADSSQSFFNADGAVFGIDTATDQAVFATVGPGCCYGNYELTLSGDQARLSGTSYFYDVNLDAESFYALNDREIMNLAYVYGAKLSPKGTLLFQPSLNGIDVFDGRVGKLLTRISLPVTLSPNYDALVTDGQDDTLVAITGINGDGIAVIDLASISEPHSLPYDRRSRRELRTANGHLSPRAGTAPSRLGKENVPNSIQPVPHKTTDAWRRGR